MEDPVLSQEKTILETRGLTAGFDGKDVVKDVSLAVPAGRITAIMGPSGCGKTTFMRCINRMHELAPNAQVTGRVLLDDEDVYQLNPILLRRRIGMVFQRPNPFPTMSIYDNVVAGYNLNGARLARADKDRIVEETLRRAPEGARFALVRALGKVGGATSLQLLLDLLADPFAQREAAEAVAEVALRTSQVEEARKALGEPGLGSSWRWSARAALGDENWVRALKAEWERLIPPSKLQALEASRRLPDALRGNVKSATSDATGQARAVWESL